MAEAASKRCRELKSPIAPSLSLSLFCSQLLFFSQALPLSVLFRQKLGVANALSLAHQKRKRKKLAHLLLYYRYPCWSQYNKRVQYPIMQMIGQWVMLDTDINSNNFYDYYNFLISQLVICQLSFHAFTKQVTWMLLWLENMKLWLKFGNGYLFSRFALTPLLVNYSPSLPLSLLSQFVSQTLTSSPSFCHSLSRRCSSNILRLKHEVFHRLARVLKGVLPHLLSPWAYI